MNLTIGKQNDCDGTSGNLTTNRMPSRVIFSQGTMMVKGRKRKRYNQRVQKVDGIHETVRTDF